MLDSIFPALRSVETFLKRIAWVVPIVSLVIALIALWTAKRTSQNIKIAGSDLKQMSANLKQAGTSLEKISANLTTQYLGEFPKTIPQITKALNEATDDIRIACDFPGYGMYSSNRDYVEYRNTITSKVTTAKVTMIVQNRKERGQLHEIQFKGKDIQQIKSADRFPGFLKWSRRDPQTIQTMPEFMTALAEEQSRALKEDFRTVERREHSGRMPLFLWIIDNRVAVVSFPTFSGGALEGAFLTRDTALIAELNRVFDNYQSESIPFK